MQHCGGWVRKNGGYRYALWDFNKRLVVDIPFGACKEWQSLVWFIHTLLI